MLIFAEGWVDMMTVYKELDITCLASPTVPGQVRTLLGIRLSEWKPIGVADDMFLIASELIANAVKSTPDREIRVRVTREPDGILLGVWDSSKEMPVARAVSVADASPDHEALDVGHDDGTGGWGLPIVKALSFRCGVKETHPKGKWVWCRVSC